ncbi:hypothetical protein [Arthrobacter sp. H20]|uniref:hypothetical protein n=1 Tax=Arthrobacter sp. H20 TaxID=1267981 RepID=UPI0020A647FA|nr:hypothetical protein [Arthrobacter sp. H20]
MIHLCTYGVERCSVRHSYAMLRQQAKTTGGEEPTLLVTTGSPSTTLTVDANVRADVQLDKSFVASIKEQE